MIYSKNKGLKIFEDLKTKFSISIFHVVPLSNTLSLCCIKEYHNANCKYAFVGSPVFGYESCVG